MEKIIASLQSRVVAEGWHESWEGGPMPKQAAEAIAYLHARAGGARENAAEEAKVSAFVANCGQSLDWIFGDDPSGMICKAAGNSPQAASLSKPAALQQLIEAPAINFESDLNDACNMAHIAAEWIERTFADKQVHRQLTGGDNAYYVAEDDLEAMHFAVYEVHAMLRRLRVNYLSAAGLTPPRDTPAL